jgi:hypothetical protein
MLVGRDPVRAVRSVKRTIARSQRIFEAAHLEDGPPGKHIKQLAVPDRSRSPLLSRLGIDFVGKIDGRTQPVQASQTDFPRHAAIPPLRTCSQQSVKNAIYLADSVTKCGPFPAMLKAETIPKQRKVIEHANARADSRI